MQTMVIQQYIKALDEILSCQDPVVQRLLIDKLLNNNKHGKINENGTDRTSKLECSRGKKN